MSPNEFTRAVLYIRVSTAKQAEHGHSLDAQRSTLMHYADRYALQVVEVIVDGGESAGTLNRPGLQRALEMVEAGDVDVIVATKGDRISRNLRDLLNLAADLERQGASIATADGTFDTTTPLGKAMTQMQGVFAELERSMASQRTSEGMAAAKAKGIRLGRPPVGFTSVGGKLEPVPGPEHDLAAKAWAMREDGASLAAIAQRLNDDGIASPRAGNWYPASIVRLIRGFVETAAAQ